MMWPTTKRDDQGGTTVSTELPKPTARRLSAPSWKDSRLLIGVLLVLASVVVGALAIGAADDRVGVWAAKGELVPGDPVGTEDLVRVEVQLGEQAGEYLASEQEIPQGATVDRLVVGGELVPRSALVDPGELEVRSVPVHVDPIYLSTLTKGSRVSVYAAEPMSADAEQAGEPAQYEKVIEQVTVAQIPGDEGGLMSSATEAAVVLLVPEGEESRLLSLDRKDRPIKLVADGGSLQQGGE